MSQIESNREKDLLELIKAICNRPQMYVGNTQIRTVADFIDGFSLGGKNYDEIREFGFWVGGKLKLMRNTAWFCNLEKVYPNDETALEHLPALFEEFRECKKNGWSFTFEYSNEMDKIRAEAEKYP